MPLPSSNGGGGNSCSGHREGRRVEGGLRAPPGTAVETRVRRFVRIWSITDRCVITATIRMGPWQVGYASVSTSKIDCGVRCIPGRCQG